MYRGEYSVLVLNVWIRMRLSTKIDYLHDFGMIDWFQMVDFAEAPRLYSMLRLNANAIRVPCPLCIGSRNPKA